MAEGCVAEVMCQADRLRQWLIETEGNGHRAADLGDLVLMRQARPLLVTFVMNEVLRFVDKAPKGR
jgi:DNA-binding protein Fis